MCFLLPLYLLSLTSVRDIEAMESVPAKKEAMESVPAKKDSSEEDCLTQFFLQSSLEDFGRYLLWGNGQITDDQDTALLGAKKTAAEMEQTGLESQKCFLQLNNWFRTCEFSQSDAHKCIRLVRIRKVLNEICITQQCKDRRALLKKHWTSKPGLSDLGSKLPWQASCSYAEASLASTKDEVKKWGTQRVRKLKEDDKMTCTHHYDDEAGKLADEEDGKLVDEEDGELADDKADKAAKRRSRKKERREKKRKALWNEVHMCRSPGRFSLVRILFEEKKKGILTQVDWTVATKWNVEVYQKKLPKVGGHEMVWKLKTQPIMPKCEKDSVKLRPL